MCNLERRKYFDWILSAITGTSLIMIMFYASSSSQLPLAASKFWGAGMFVAAIPFSISSLLISKEAALHQKNTLDSVDKWHSLFFLLSVLFFLIGFIIFTHSLSSHLSVILSITGILSIAGFIKVRKSFLQDIGE